MKGRDSGLFTATAIPAGIVALALTGWVASRHAAALGPTAPDLVLTILFASFSYHLSFSASGAGKVSLELGYLIAATLGLPFPSALIVGAATGVIGSLLRVQSAFGTPLFYAVTGANVASRVLMASAASAAAAWLRPRIPESEHTILPPLLLAAALFVVMNTVNLLTMMVWMRVRGYSASEWGRHFLTRILMGEAVTVPFGCLLVFVLNSKSGHIGFVLLAAIGLYVSFVLKTLSRSEERVRRVNGELEERVSELATLNAVGREISSSLDPARVFRIVRRECRKVFRPDFFFIARFDAETREIHVEHSMAGDAPLRSATLPLGQGLASYVISTEKPLLIADLAHDPRTKNMRPIVVEAKIRSVLAVPLFVENRVVGVLSVQCFREAAYEERHVSLLTTIGQQAAIALENARHYQMATVDHLTGLYQRDYFFQRLGDEHRRASRYGSNFSVLMLDLDSFKKINDQFGHFSGDRFLKAVGVSIRAMLRAADVPCRYGGEEFCVLLPETDLAGAQTIAERIREAIGALTVTEAGQTLSTTVSIGVSAYPVHFEGNLTGLLQKADQALYTAKLQGRDRVIAAAA